jgi:hypothetical protein
MSKIVFYDDSDEELEDEIILSIKNININEKTFDEFLNEKIKNSWELNINEVIKDSKKEKIPFYLDNKIKNECVRKGFEYKNILNQIKISKEYASFFAKDPLKQNIAEKIQLEYINYKKKSNEIIKLPSTGPESVSFKDGKLVYNVSGTTKKFDFKNKNNKEYYYAKYTKEEGGAQDNQYNDAILFLEQANLYYKENDNDDIKFILIVDGKYYEKKIDNMKRMIKHKNIFVKTSNEL